jgi:hypothetical protein
MVAAVTLSTTCPALQFLHSSCPIELTNFGASHEVQLVVAFSLSTTKPGPHVLQLI